MIVAAGTSHAQAEERVGRHIGHVDEHLIPLPGDVALVVFVQARTQISGGHDCIWIGRRDLISGELLGHKAIVRLIFIERTNHVIAIGPRVGSIIIGLKSVRLGIRTTSSQCLPHRSP